jgi:uncharacterized protein (DUF58 family)
MAFRSHLAPVTKRDRAIVLALAAAELLVSGGERVGLLGLTRPTASRQAAMRLAEQMALHGERPELSSSLPPEVRVTRFSGAILISDFLDPVETIATRLKAIASPDVAGHLVQVLDPAEETLPYNGRTRFEGLQDEGHLLVKRAETVRDEYRRKMAEHQAGLADLARQLGWHYTLNRTDHSAESALLALFVNLTEAPR